LRKQWVKNCHIQVHLFRNYISIVISPPNYTSLPLIVAIFLVTCLITVLQPSEYSVFHSRDTPIVRCSLHRGRSLQNGLRDEQTCGTILASAYVLRHLSAMWSRLQMKKRKSEWKWVLIGVLPLNTGDRVQWEFISVNYQTSELQCNY